MSTWIWIIIEYTKAGPTRVWAFDSEDKAREFGRGLYCESSGASYRIGTEILQ